MTSSRRVRSASSASPQCPTPPPAHNGSGAPPASSPGRQDMYERAVRLFSACNSVPGKRSEDASMHRLEQCPVEEPRDPLRAQ